MDWEGIRALNLKPDNIVEVCYRAGKEEAGRLKLAGDEFAVRCGYVRRVFELPEGMAEIPAEYKDSCPAPRFLEVSYALEGHNYTGRDTIKHKPEDICWIKKLSHVE